jgi:hypothetical protein
MRLLLKDSSYDDTIIFAKKMNEEYNKEVTFHAYWNGKLNEKHFLSVKSCYHFNVKDRFNRKIIIWIENNTPSEFNDKISKYAELRIFNLKEEIKGIFMENMNYTINYSLSFYSDTVRYILLYKYGGCWFDLDIFFLRNFDPIFYNFENEICVYEWETQSYPNGAIFISIIPYSQKMKQSIEFIINRNRGWGFQEANLTYDLPLDMLVLPCSWFDPSWITNPYNLTYFDFFRNSDKQYTFDNFFNGSFCYHWHNQWNDPIEENSIIYQLDKLLV